MQKSLFAATFISAIYCVEPNPPNWDTNKVKVISPGQNAQGILDQIHNEQGGHQPAFNGEWSNDRYALLFKAGDHTGLSVDLGFYVTVHGLGRKPTDTVLGNLMVLNGDYNMTGGALSNFWRSAENVSVTPNGPMIWAVSQASPMRRIQVNGDLNLFHYNPPNTGAGYASGGFMADCYVSGTIISGSQQQFMTRNTHMGQWKTGVWNMVFVGTENAPATHCSNSGGGPYTTVNQTPVIAEKPYIISEGNSYTLMKPRIEKNKVGTTPNWQNADEISFSDVYVANENDSAATINAKLAEGLHLVLQPGNYKLTEAIKVTKAGTVVMGMGMATLIAQSGNSAIEVGNVDDVRIAGVLLQAGPGSTKTLLKWGEAGYAGSSSNPGVMSDVFARVGGTNASSDVKAEIMVQINSGNVIVDDTWLWRADHDVGGLVKNGRNPSNTGLQVNGDNVTGYGLACEHTLENLLEWNGNYGQSFFYQSEFPYDVTNDYGTKGYSGYHVSDSVTNHFAYGVGVYSFFRDNWVTVNSAIKAPAKTGVRFFNALSVFLNGNGQINHVIDNDGATVKAGQGQAWDCYFQSEEDSKVEDFLI